VVEASAPDWRPQAIVGMVIMLNVVSLKVSTPGPWDSESFTLGLMGSVSMVLLYISWYRITFKRRGLIPWVDLWAEPKKSANLVLLSSVVILSIAWFTGNNMQDILPRPTGLVLSLVGFLMLAQSLYVLLSVGPLSED
jgi:multisubunit Na+/H+ antiporter MnhB subunit